VSSSSNNLERYRRRLSASIYSTSLGYCESLLLSIDAMISG